MTANDVREELLALSCAGDTLRGGDWQAVIDWHQGVVYYVRQALGDAAADDVANRLRCKRGSTQAEKEYNAIGFVTEWLGMQALGLTDDKIVPGFDGVVEVTAVEEPVVEEPEPVPEPIAEEEPVVASDDPVVVVEDEEGGLWRRRARS